MLARPTITLSICANTIVDYYGCVVITARIALGIYRLEALKRRLVDGPELRRRRFGRAAP